MRSKLMFKQLVVDSLPELKRGLAGMVASAGGIAVSLQNCVQWLQAISLVVGIAVGLATLVSLIITIRSKLKGRDDQ